MIDRPTEGTYAASLVWSPLTAHNRHSHLKTSPQYSKYTHWSWDEGTIAPSRPQVTPLTD